ncbi:protein CHUP1, chloroplastic isoform X2 [Momordica charantia]|uniref:Protein CHUP1, chloroplastic isoform X2 n=1 Tax=Momordica charantia TaxID=3673 RepID=A0A6J1D2B1_MOMCH|nr:protein CHUP1, chloroplastic isoform X2 [Momordica charantia]
MEEKRNLKPILLKFGVVLAISFAGFLYSRFRIRKKRPRLPPPSSSSSDQGNKVDLSRGRGPKLDNQAIKEEMYIPKVNVDDSNVGLCPSSKRSVDKDGLFLPELQELVKESDFPAANAGLSHEKNVEALRSGLQTPKAYNNFETDDYEQEIRHLKSKVKMLRERERNLEVQLLEYYGLKEQETAVMELQNRLKINNMEAKLFTLKIESLQADNRRLESQVSDHAKSVSDLEAARAKIKFLKKKLRYEAEQNRGQILNLQQRVAKLHDQEYKTNESNKDARIKLKRIEDLEKEVEDLRNSNLRLQIENSDLARRLDATQVLANSILEDPEVTLLAKESLKEERERLGQENENLMKEIEQLQAHRCADVEELVYLRWINACLRYELRNYQPRPGKTAARDLSKTLSPKSEEKAKKLILEYANTEGIEGKGINIMDFDSDQWSSSQASSLTDQDDSYVDFQATTKPSSNKIKFISKLRKLLKGKDSQQNQALSAEKSAASMEDSDSPRYSSSNSTGTNATRAEGQGIGSANSSQSSSRHSMDFRRLSSQEYGKPEDSVRRNSDGGYTNKRLVLGSNRMSNSPFKTPSPDTESSEKSELMKYAEVLKDSPGAKNRSHRKGAASIDSY